MEIKEINSHFIMVFVTRDVDMEGKELFRFISDVEKISQKSIRFYVEHINYPEGINFVQIKK